MVIDPTAVSKRDREDAYMSEEPISYEQALTILRDSSRQGQVSVFTADRGDALKVMRDAIGGREPFETRDSDGLFSFPGRCLLRTRADRRKPKVIYLAD